MRNRSMSVCVPKDRDRLSKKFEGVSSDNEAHFDSEDESKAEVVADEWTKADYDSLIAQLKDTIPKKDHRKWKTALQAVNWEQITIRRHTVQEVENVAKQLIAKVRLFRTFGEILDDVPEVVNKVLGADKPKPPLTAYSLFVKEMLPKLREEHKDMRVQQIFKIVPKLFQELSAKKRRRFEEAAAHMKQEYQANLSKFYLDHPDVAPKKVRKEPLKTPFQLFYQSRRSSSDNISCQQARKEWEQMTVKKKVKYIRASFDVQADTQSKLLNKKELEILDHHLGKPEFVGRNVYEFFRRKVRSNYASNGNEREQQIRIDYKKLDAQEQVQLKEEFQNARTAFVLQYQNYIKKLPKEKQQMEIDFLKTISDKNTKKSGAEKNAPKKTAMKNEVHSAGSADEDLPSAESTTINKKLLTGKKEKRKQRESADESETSDNRSSSKKQSKILSFTAATPPSTSKATALLSISKSEPSSSSASSSDEEDEHESTKISTSQKNVPTPQSRNGSARKISETKKRTAAEDVKPQIEMKKSKKTSYEKDDTPPPPAIIATNSAKTKESTEKKLKEPEKPPKEIQEFYRQRFYKGKLGKHVESFENLTLSKKREIGEQFKAVQKQYIADFEQYLKSLPKDEIRKYIQKVNAQKQAQSTDDDSDGEDGDTEEGSSSEEEEEDE